MFKKLTFTQRLQVGIVLAVAFLLVLGSNRLHRRHMSNLQHTANSVYHDRLATFDIIYRLNNELHKEKVLQLGNQAPADNWPDFREAVLLLEQLEMSGRKGDEMAHLSSLRSNLESLRTLHETTPTEREEDHHEGAMLLSEATEDLRALSQIQLTEAGRLSARSDKSFRVSEILLNLEVSFLILIGLAIAVLTFSPAIRSGGQANEELMGFK